MAASAAGISQTPSLKGKVALVTGGGSGIGRAIVERFAREGACVEILERDAAAATGVLKEISQAGGEAAVSACDISDHAATADAVAAILERRGRIDILVNNAGIAHVGTAIDTPEADFDRIYQTNVKGVYNCLHAVLPSMVNHGGGVILNMASVASLTGIADRFAYSMSKGAVLTMTYSVAIDYVRKGIRCNCLCPARVHTPFVDGFLARNYPGQEATKFKELSDAQPIGRMAQPEEIASFALFLCSDEAAFITGTAFPIDGGFMNAR